MSNHPLRHPISLKGYETLEQAARDIAALRYDAMADLIRKYSEELDRYARADSACGKNNLATEGFRAAEKAKELELKIREMMNISRPHMKADLGERLEIMAPDKK